MVKWKPDDPDYDPMYVPSSDERAPELLRDLQGQTMYILNILNGTLIPEKDGPRRLTISERVSLLYGKLQEANKDASNAHCECYRLRDELTKTQMNAKASYHCVGLVKKSTIKLEQRLCKARKEIEALRKKTRR